MSPSLAIMYAHGSVVLLLDLAVLPEEGKVLRAGLDAQLCGSIGLSIGLELAPCVCGLRLWNATTMDGRNGRNSTDAGENSC